MLDGEITNLGSTIANFNPAVTEPDKEVSEKHHHQ